MFDRERRKLGVCHEVAADLVAADELAEDVGPLPPSRALDCRATMMPARQRAGNR